MKEKGQGKTNPEGNKIRTPWKKRIGNKNKNS